MWAEMLCARGKWWNGMLGNRWCSAWYGRFHIRKRTGQSDSVVRVFVKPSSSSVQPVCSVTR
jgi:hypothetical protein